MVLVNELTNDIEADQKAANEAGFYFQAANEAVFSKLHVAAMNGFS